jgi:hypothetical protein
MFVMAKKALETTGMAITINEPNFKWLTFTIQGDTPFVQLRFSEKQKLKMLELHAEDEKDAGTKKKTRTPKNYDELYHEAMYETEDGSRGINANSFKRAMVAACRLTNLPMKIAKLCFFVEHDDFDKSEHIPLVKFTKGEPQPISNVCRNANMMPDVRIRAAWEPGWECKLRVKYDADMLSAKSVENLLMRAGSQVGVGEGRPDATRSDGAGMGWGTFKIIEVMEG